MNTAEKTAASQVPQHTDAGSGSQGVGRRRVPDVRESADNAASQVPQHTDAYIGIDIGSISTKGVIVDADRRIIARSYRWTEGNPAQAARDVVAELGSQIDRETVKVRAAGTTGSARRLIGAMVGAETVKNEITAHAVGTTYLHPDVRTILEIGGQDSKIICVEGGVSKNAGVVKAFEEELGMPVIVDPDGHLMGAFGVALLAADNHGRRRAGGEETPKADGPFASGELDFDAVGTFAFTTREVECGRCANRCEIICVYRDDELVDSWGNRCEKGAVRR